MNELGDFDVWLIKRSVRKAKLRVRVRRACVITILVLTALLALANLAPVMNNRPRDAATATGR